MRTINVNRGHNGNLLKKSPTLYGYAYFVSLVRKNMESMELKEAVERVNRLIRILSEQNRINDITRAASDKAYQEKLFEELGI